ncbi:unnamed protein product [Strongylus vulgaris]|uniref:EGF-like domain-containing protein n=1 Tax=Strongylus vulgaris TaxID=40348 RepID=A0A3P7LQ33_STRVU|nr:unnamed protein product [Strongylus vulgaris]
MVVQSPLLPNHQHLSDMRWHTLLFYQEERSSLYMLLVDNTTVVTESGAPPSAPLVRSGFRGCLAGFRLNDQAIDVYDDSEDKKDVVRGCSGPLARCSPGACSNRGRCIQQWNSIRCDCTLTAHAGDRCQDG